MQYNLDFCSNCYTDREADQRGPCPDCGSTRTTHTMFMPVTLTLGDTGGIVTEYGQERWWQEQWYRARQHFDELKKIYQPGGFPGDSPARGVVEDFFHHCLHVGDWLWSDTKNSLDKPAVQKFIREDQDLKICAGLANTSKHYERDRVGSINARVLSVWHNQADNSTVATVEWWRQGEEDKRTKLDALQLAEGCKKAWKRYLKSHTLRLSRVGSI